MSWKIIIVIVALIGGAVGYYLWTQVPETPPEQTSSNAPLKLAPDILEQSPKDTAIKSPDISPEAEAEPKMEGSQDLPIKDNPSPEKTEEPS